MEAVTPLVTKLSSDDNMLKNILSSDHRKSMSIAPLVLPCLPYQPALTSYLVIVGFIPHLGGGEGEVDLHPVVLHLRDDDQLRPARLRCDIVDIVTLQGLCVCVW